jgi:hypothetical protein
MCLTGDVLERAELQPAFAFPTARAFGVAAGLHGRAGHLTARSDWMRPEQKPGGGDYKLQPHSYSIGDMAFQALMANPNTPQAVLICGESGAGKTECCKFVLSYLIAKGSQQAAKAGKKAGGADSLTDQLLATVRARPGAFTRSSRSP